MAGKDHLLMVISAWNDPLGARAPWNSGAGGWFKWHKMVLVWYYVLPPRNLMGNDWRENLQQKDCCWPILAPNWLGFSVSMFPTSISGRRTKRYPNMEMIGWCLVDVFSCFFMFFPYHGNFRGHWWTMWEHHCSTKGWYGGMGSSCPRRSSGYSCDASKHSLDTGQTTSNIQYVLSGKPLGWFLGNKTLKIANVAAFYVLQHQGCKCVLFFQPHMAALQQPLLCRNQIPSNWW